MSLLNDRCQVATVGVEPRIVTICFSSIDQFNDMVDVDPKMFMKVSMFFSYQFLSMYVTEMTEIISMMDGTFGEFQGECDGEVSAFYLHNYQYCWQFVIRNDASSVVWQEITS